jgi:hypothetical protein
MIKKSWANPMEKHRPDKVMVCMRFTPDTLITCSTNRFPPTELVDGKRLSADQAEHLNLLETHITLGYVDAEDLTDLINHLTKIRDSLPVHEDL